MRYIVRDCQKLSETEKDCIALELFVIHLNSVYSYPVVAFSRSKVSVGIAVQKTRSRKDRLSKRTNERTNE